jgi:hypothetical protein
MHTGRSAYRGYFFNSMQYCLIKVFLWFIVSSLEFSGDYKYALRNY